jgi:hypothetical protein
MGDELMKSPVMIQNYPGDRGHLKAMERKGVKRSKK